MIDINSIKISDFLSRIGITPKSRQGCEYIYYSPFRSEAKPSFFVNEDRNCWYDFGMPDNDNWGLVGFIMRYYNVDGFAECIKILSEVMELPSQDFKCVPEKPKNVLEVISIEDITSDEIYKYIKSRNISVRTTKRYLKQCNFKYFGYDKVGLCYKNINDGLEIIFLNGMKSVVGSKGYTYLPGKGSWNVFEGYFDYLAYLYLLKKRYSTRHIIILNSTTSTKKALKAINPLETVHLFLDHDVAGNDAARMFKNKFDCVDHKGEYIGVKDVNDLLNDMKNVKDRR